MTQETKYPAAARELQKSISEGLPETERADWHAAFSEKAETVTDWQIVIDKTVLASLRIAEPHDRSGKFVATVIDLYERRLAGENPSDDEWYDAQIVAWDAEAARVAAWSAARAAAYAAAYAAGGAAYAAYAAQYVARAFAWAVVRDADAARVAAWVQIRDAFLNA